MSLRRSGGEAGVSRAALSHIETSQGNPTVGVLWKISMGLGIPFAELLGEAREDIGVLRKGKNRRSSVRRDGKMESRPLTPAGAAPWAELYELRLARAGRPTPPRRTRPGRARFLVVLSGAAPACAYSARSATTSRPATPCLFRRRQGLTSTRTRQRPRADITTSSSTSGETEGLAGVVRAAGRQPLTPTACGGARRSESAPPSNERTAFD